VTAPAPFFDGTQPCAQTDPEAFFPEKGGSTREAKRLCAGCEFRIPCLEYATTAASAGVILAGIWGGTSERERRRIRVRDGITVARGGRRRTAEDAA
jgi:hypothetical protein